MNLVYVVVAGVIILFLILAIRYYLLYRKGMPK
jgi:hypothetical protein